MYSGDENCSELDFFDTLTAEDTHLYHLDSLDRNDGVTAPVFDGESRSQHGIVVITPVVGAADAAPIAFNNLHATVTWDTRVLDDDVTDGGDFIRDGVNYRFNAFGRDAINFATGAKAPDGTSLDGIAAGFERIIPNYMMYHYTSTPFFEAEDVFADLIFLAISDDYFGNTGENYKAVGGATSKMSIEHVVDNVENTISCGDVTVSCMEIYGINTEIKSTIGGFGFSDNFPPATDKIISDITDYDEGFDVLVARPGAPADAIFGVIGLISSDAGGAAHMFVQ